MLRHIDADFVVFPFREGIEQIALPAQQAEGSFVETDAVAHQRDHPVGQREHQHHYRRRQQKTKAQRQRQKVTKEFFHLA